MRILHLYKDYHPVLGGIENHIKMLAEAQAAAGHQVTAAVTNPGRLEGEELINGVRVMRLPRLLTAASTPLTPAFLTFLRRSEHDIAHLHFPYPVAEISQLAAGRGRPYVITYHSDVVRPSQQAFLRCYAPLLARVLERAGCIIATSQNYIDSSACLRPISAKCRVVPLGIDPQPFIKRQPLIERGARPALLFVGRCRYYKGVDILLRALSETPAELWVGGDGPMRSEWQRLARELGVNERVRFLGDIAEGDLPGLYAAADLFVLPATMRAEAFGTVLLEAMASGLACITTELSTGTSHVVQDGVTGLVVQPGSPPALAGAINTLLEDDLLRCRMGEAGRKRVRSEFTLETMAVRVEGIYRQVLERRNILHAD